VLRRPSLGRDAEVAIIGRLKGIRDGVTLLVGEAQAGSCEL
jgi:hypothetical protein